MAPKEAMTLQMSTVQGRVRSQAGDTSAQRVARKATMVTMPATAEVVMSFRAVSPVEWAKRFHAAAMTAPDSNWMPMKMNR